MLANNLLKSTHIPCNNFYLFFINEIQKKALTTKIGQNFQKEQQQVDFSASKWGNGAKEYHRSFGSKFEIYASLVLQDIETNIENANNHTNLKLLDIGCGSGATLAAIESHPKQFHFNIKEFHGIDFSHEMVEQCQQRQFISNQIHTNNNDNDNNNNNKRIINFTQMDGQNLKFPDNHFDITTGLFSLIFFPDVNKGLTEAYRVLKSRSSGSPGMIAVSGWADIKKIDWIRFSNKALRLALDKRNIVLPDTSSAPPPNFQRWSDINALKTQLENAKFTNVQIQFLTQRFKFQTSDQIRSLWLDMSKSFPSLDFALENFSNGNREELSHEVADLFAKLVIERQCETPEVKDCIGYLDGTAVLGLGIKP